MTETPPAREGERCPRCGTPVEMVDVTSHEETGVEDIVLRCPNGHEIRVSRHHDGSEGEAKRDGTAGNDPRAESS